MKATNALGRPTWRVQPWIRLKFVNDNFADIQDFKDEKDLPRVIQHESLYIDAVDNPILKPELAAGMPRVMPNLKQELVRGGGHWLLWEKKAEVIDILQRWLKRLDLSETSSSDRMESFFIVYI
ncbi:hypothetical protein PRIC2_012252 [Phytophthora ramorum]